MRVTIQIDDDDAGAETAPSLASGASPVASPDIEQAVPAELAARAARLGARSAGPAPSGPPETSGAPGLATTDVATASDASPRPGATGDDALSAGAAPIIPTD